MEFGCKKCGSAEVFIEPGENQKALKCKGCGKWIKWVGKKDLCAVEKYISDMEISKAEVSGKGTITDYNSYAARELPKSMPWTNDVVYKVYCNDELETLPVKILQKMACHISSIISDKIQDI